MIGTHLGNGDTPRLIRSEHGWWFIGNQTWTLLKADAVRPDGTLRDDIDAFLRAVGAYRRRCPESYSLTVLTATNCNLGCGYCFQNTALDPKGANRPTRIGRAWLDTSTIDETIHFATDRMTQAGLKKLSLLLFGGEPLLNPHGCLQLLRRSQSVGLVEATMATN